MERKSGCITMETKKNIEAFVEKLRGPSFCPEGGGSYAL